MLFCFDIIFFFTFIENSSNATTKISRWKLKSITLVINLWICQESSRFTYFDLLSLQHQLELIHPHVSWWLSWKRRAFIVFSKRKKSWNQQQMLWMQTYLRTWNCKSLWKQLWEDENIILRRYCISIILVCTWKFLLKFL